MGIDGSGKTTVSKHLAKSLQELGYDVDIMWLRFNHVLSKPLLGLCRLIGFTRYDVKDGIRVGYHDFHRSRVISWIFLRLQYLDAWRVLHTKILPKMRGDKKVLILDRYVYDILVDLMVDTGLDDLLTSRTGKAFTKLLPEEAMLILVDRDYEEVLQSRPEGRIDDNFYKRYVHYKMMREQFPGTVLDNHAGLPDLLRAAEVCIGLQS
jgi:thymidylate kinase